MTKRCNIFVTKAGDQVLAGIILLHEDGSFTYSPSVGFEILMQNLVNDRMGVAPVDWFNALPKTYTGSYLRAEIED